MDILGTMEEEATVKDFVVSGVEDSSKKGGCKDILNI
jgi:hypothetical protein